MKAQKKAIERRGLEIKDHEIFQKEVNANYKGRMISLAIVAIILIWFILSLIF